MNLSKSKYLFIDFDGVVVDSNFFKEKAIEKAILTLFGDDLTIDDIVWEGERMSVKKMSELAGIDHIEKNSSLNKFLANSDKVHTLPAYRDDHRSFLKSLFT